MAKWFSKADRHWLFFGNGLSIRIDGIDDALVYYTSWRGYQRDACMCKKDKRLFCESLICYGHHPDDGLLSLLGVSRQEDEK